MKIPVKSLLFFLAFSALALPLFAQGAEVIRQDGKTVYFDLSDTKKLPRGGDLFEIVLPGEEIINPKTGKSLGREEGERINGTIVRVKDLFAVGELGKDIEVLGLKAQFKSKNNPAEQNVLFLEAEFPEQNAVKPLWQSPAFKEAPRFAALCDIDGNAINEAVLSFARDNEIKIFSLSENKKLLEKASYKIPRVKNILALDCATLPDTGKATLFVTIFNPLDNTFETLPLSMEGGELKAGKPFEGLTQGLAPYNRSRVLYTQKVVKTGKRNNLTPPARLIFENGAYQAGEALKIKGLNTIFGFNMADLEGDGVLTPIYITQDGKIRTRLGEPTDFALSEGGNNFSVSPNVFEFNKAKHSLYLPLPIFNGGEEGKTFLAAAQNNMDKDNPSANIYILKWTGSNFGKYKVLPLQGTLYDMKQGNFGPFKNTLAAVYGTAEGGFMAVYATDNF